MNTKKIISLGVALFAMFFGAGNVVFPLDLGRILGDNVVFGLVGLTLSAVLMPLIGVFAGILYDGDYRAFFARLGTIPGELLTLICMITIGAFGAIPRTITLSHAAFSWYFPTIPLWLFTIIAGILILLATLRKAKVIDVIGQLLGPIKVVLLTSIIIAGFFAPMSLEHTSFGFLESFWRGFVEGYGTLDLLGAIFFAKLIMVSLNRDEYKSHAHLLKDMLKAGAIGAGLLGLIYAGFMLTSAFHGQEVALVGRDQIIFALGDLLLGRLGIFASFTVAMACLTTAIALTAVFADYVSTDLFRGKVPYKTAVIGSVFIECALANLGFEGVMKVIIPIAFACYPAMIVLCILNIAYKVFGFEPVKLPVYLTFGISLVRVFGWF